MRIAIVRSSIQRQGWVEVDHPRQVGRWIDSSVDTIDEDFTLKGLRLWGVFLLGLAHVSWSYY